MGYLFIFSPLGQATTVTLDGVDNGQIYDRTVDRPVTLSILMEQGEILDRIEIHLVNVGNAPLYGQIPTITANPFTPPTPVEFSVATLTPGATPALTFAHSLEDGTPFQFLSNLQCQFPNLSGYGTNGYGYEPGEYNFGYGYAEGYGYLSGAIECTFLLRLTQFDLGVPESDFIIQAQVHRLGSDDNGYGYGYGYLVDGNDHSTPQIRFTVEDLAPTGVSLSLGQSTITLDTGAQFTLTASDPDRSITQSRYELDLDTAEAGSILSGTFPDTTGTVTIPSQFYPVPGTYTAGLTVTDIDGKSVEDSVQIVVEIPNNCVPMVQFTGLDGGLANQYAPGGTPGFTGAADAVADLEVKHVGQSCPNVFNQPPHLSAGYVDPIKADALTAFDYNVTYYDLDNNAPASITVRIDDGEPQDMVAAAADADDSEFTDGDYTNGENFTFTGFLPSPVALGQHEFEFNAHDGFQAAEPLAELGPEIGELESHTGTVLVPNPTNRAIIEATGGAFEFLPPLSGVDGGPNGIDSNTFALPDDALPGARFVLGPDAASQVDTNDPTGVAGLTLPNGEVLRNGDLEGEPSEYSGFILIGDSAALHADDANTPGEQSVNVARAGGASDDDGVLGAVQAFAHEGVTLRSVDTFSFFYGTDDNEPFSDPVRFRWHLMLDKDLDGDADACVTWDNTTGAHPIPQPVGWNAATFGDDTQVTVSDDASACAGAPLVRPLNPGTGLPVDDVFAIIDAELQSFGTVKLHPVYGEAAVHSVVVQAITDPGVTDWPVGQDVYVDELSITLNPRPDLVDDWDICFYAGPPTLGAAPIKCHSATGSEGETIPPLSIPTGATHANVWAHFLRPRANPDAPLATPSFRFAYVVVQDPDAIPIPTGPTSVGFEGTLTVAHDDNGDGLYDDGDTIIGSPITGIGASIDPQDFTGVSLPISTVDGLNQYVAFYETAVPLPRDGLLANEATATLEILKFINDVPEAEIFAALAGSPDEDFESDSVDIGLGDEVEFLIEAQDDDDDEADPLIPPLGGIKEWSLDFGEMSVPPATGTGDPAGTSVLHTYAAIGTYTATLTVTDEQGEVVEDTIDIEIFTVFPPTVTLTATPVIGLEPLDVDFTASATDPDGTIASWTMDFGDGDIDSDTGTPPTTFGHDYLVQGIFTATLTAVDNEGRTGSDSVTITVIDSNDPPIADLNADPLSVLLEDLITFTATGSDPGGAIASATLDFGDGTPGHSFPLPLPKTVSHEYAATGTYTATLTVTDDEGLTATDTVTVSVADGVTNAPPGVDLSGNPLTGTAPLEVSFDLDGSDADGTLAGFSFTPFVGATPITGTTLPTTQAHTYAAPGTFTATLVVTDDDGATATDTVTVVVTSSLPPTATLEVDPATGRVPLRVGFLLGASDDIGISTWTLDFGDGTDDQTGTGTPTPEIDHTYALPGTFTATLTVEDDEGQTATATAPVTATERDRDNDGIGDSVDNCPNRRNPNQEDADGDGIGNACDGDSDNDGKNDGQDNCPLVANAGQADIDGDGKGDACDDDSTDGPTGDPDGDGVVNKDDNCASVANPGQADVDGDDKGDACDDNNNDGPKGDLDGDGVINEKDNCKETANANQADVDGDGKGDLCDDNQEDGPKGDLDGDGFTNQQEQAAGSDPRNAQSTPGDVDGDGIDNPDDNCLKVANPEQDDTDGDGEGDACDDNKPGVNAVTAVNTPDGVRITWTVIGEPGVTSRLEFGATPALGATRPAHTGPGTYSETLTGLAQGITFSYQITATNPTFGTTTTVESTFTTPAAGALGVDGVFAIIPVPTQSLSDKTVQFSFQLPEGTQEAWIEIRDEDGNLVKRIPLALDPATGLWTGEGTIGDKGLMNVQLVYEDEDGQEHSVDQGQMRVQSASVLGGLADVAGSTAIAAAALACVVVLGVVTVVRRLLL